MVLYNYTVNSIHYEKDRRSHRAKIVVKWCRVVPAGSVILSFIAFGIVFQFTVVVVYTTANSILGVVVKTAGEPQVRDHRSPESLLEGWIEHILER